MTIMKSLCLTAAAGILLLAGEGAAFAAEDCAAQVKALAPAVQNVTNADIKAKAEKLLNTAEKEATEEMDEDECIDALKDAKALLGVQ
jgi:hypothetical protein